MVANKDNEMQVEYLSLTELKQLTNALMKGRKSIYTGHYMILTAIYTGWPTEWATNPHVARYWSFAQDDQR